MLISASMLSLYSETIWIRETFLKGVLLSGSIFSTLNLSSKIFLSYILVSIPEAIQLIYCSLFL